MKFTMPLQTLVENSEFEVAKYKEVLSKFPDAKTFNNTNYGSKFIVYGFSSKLVNSNYNDYTFTNWNNFWLYIEPHFEFNFSYNGRSEVVCVHSSPRRISLAKLIWIRGKDYNYLDNKYIIRFCNFKLLFKKKEFSEKCLNDCRLKILDFIKVNSKYKIDDKNLEPRLKKLLLFT